MVFALLLASNEVFMNYLAFFELIYCLTTLPVLFIPLTPAVFISAELFRSIEEFTVYCKGSPML